MKRFSQCLCLLLSLVLFVSGCAVSPDTADAGTPSSTATSTTATEPIERDISFLTNTNVRLQTETAGLEYPVRFGGHVLFGKAQLDGMKLDEMTLYVPYPEMIGYVPLDLTPYTEAYFSDKALVVLLMHSSSSNVHMRVDSLTVSENTLTVDYTEERPMVLTAEACDWCVLLEVDASAVKDVTAVVGNRKTEPLSD